MRAVQAATQSIDYGSNSSFGQAVSLRVISGGKDLITVVSRHKKGGDAQLCNGGLEAC